MCPVAKNHMAHGKQHCPGLRRMMTMQMMMMMMMVVLVLLSLAADTASAATLAVAFRTLSGAWLLMNPVLIMLSMMIGR